MQKSDGPMRGARFWNVKEIRVKFGSALRERNSRGSKVMSIRDAMGAIMLAAALALPAVAQAFDESKYPDMQAQWSRPRGVGIQWDPSKPGGRGQQPPLTAEYQA